MAVIDDGFDLSHPALRDILWQRPGRPGVHGWNFVADNSDLAPATEVPVSSHGTMVAGIIGGCPDPVCSFAGVAPNVKLMLLRWRSNRPPEAHADPAKLAAALRFAVENGARIVNLSASIDSTRKSPEALTVLRRAFELAEKREVLIVVAAPNLPVNLNAATTYLPGVYPFNNVLHVTGLCRELRLLGSWGAKTVDIAAPAEDIPGPTVAGGYRSGCATSFAAPLVSGALALVWGLLPKLKAEHVRTLILRNAKSTGNRDSAADAGKPRASMDLAGTGTGWLLPHEVWGHEFPAMPQGRLDLEFVEEAWQRYHAGRSDEGCFPAGVARRRLVPCLKTAHRRPNRCGIK